MRATISGNRKVQAWLAIGFAAMVVGFIVGGVGLYQGGRDTAAFDKRICEHVNTLDSALLSVLDRSFKGLPTNAYYRQHPGELKTALANTRYAITLIENARCLTEETK